MTVHNSPYLFSKAKEKGYQNHKRGWILPRGLTFFFRNLRTSSTEAVQWITVAALQCASSEKSRQCSETLPKPPVGYDKGPYGPVWARMGPARAHAPHETISEINPFFEKKAPVRTNHVSTDHLSAPDLSHGCIQLSNGLRELWDIFGQFCNWGFKLINLCVQCFYSFSLFLASLLISA